MFATPFQMECWAISSIRVQTIFLPISGRAVPHTVSDSIQCSVNLCSVNEPTHFSSSPCVLVQATPTDLPYSERTSEDYQRNSKNETQTPVTRLPTVAFLVIDVKVTMLFFNDLLHFSFLALLVAYAAYSVTHWQLLLQQGGNKDKTKTSSLDSECQRCFWKPKEELGV